jgi:hypothetical protein
LTAKQLDYEEWRQSATWWQRLGMAFTHEPQCLEMLVLLLGLFLVIGYLIVRNILV